MKTKQIIGTVVAAAALTVSVTSPAEATTHHRPQGDPTAYAWLVPGVRWNPCAGPLTYSYPHGSALKLNNDITRSVGQITKATGIPMVEVASGAQIVITYSNSTADAELTGDTMGYSQNMMDAAAPNSKWFVSSRIVFNSKYMGNANGGRSARRALIMHELAHTMGLGHVSDQRQLMSPTDMYATHLESGDLAGLAAVGASAGC